MGKDNLGGKSLGSISISIDSVGKSQKSSGDSLTSLTSKSNSSDSNSNLVNSLMSSGNSMKSGGNSFNSGAPSLHKAAAFRNKQLYDEAIALCNKKSITSLTKAISIFESIPDWEDSKEQKLICEAKLKE